MEIIRVSTKILVSTVQCRYSYNYQGSQAESLEEGRIRITELCSSAF